MTELFTSAETTFSLRQPTLLGAACLWPASHPCETLCHGDVFRPFRGIRFNAGASEGGSCPAEWGGDCSSRYIVDCPVRWRTG